MAKVPNGIKLASILVWFGAFAGIVAAMYAAISGAVVESYFGLTGMTFAVTTAAIVTFIVALVWAFVGIMLWKSNYYAWWIVFLFSILGMVGFIIGGIVGLAGVYEGIYSFSVMSFMSFLVTLVIFLSIVDKKSMSSVRVKVGRWKGIDLF